MKKRIICLALAVIMVFGLCACGGSGKYRVVKTLGTQEYSIGFRNGDSTYHYIDRALKELSYEGAIDELCYKWFGDDSTVSFREPTLPPRSTASAESTPQGSLRDMLTSPPRAQARYAATAAVPLAQELSQTAVSVEATYTSGSRLPTDSS